MAAAAGWPADVKHHTWPLSTSRETRTAITPITNSVRKRLPLWLGPLPDAERKLREAQGKK